MESMVPLAAPSTGHNATKNAKEVRECLKEFFCNEGVVEWQWDKYLENDVNRRLSQQL